MASIQTAIELQDNFTGVMYGIINAMNMTVSTMEEVQQTMNADVDTSAFEGIHNEVNQATIALDELNAAMQSIDAGSQGIINVDVNPVLPEPLVENPQPIHTPIQPNALPDPVEIPVLWETNGLEVFNSSGIERFEQEIQSANSMMEQLSSTQNEIARQAYNTTLFPPEAFQDLNRLAVRIDMVRDRIQQIENNPLNVGTDIANAELEQLRSQLAQAVQEQNELNTAMQNMDVSAANDAYVRLSHTVGSTERYIRDNTDEQGRFNQEIRNGISQADNLLHTIAGAAGAYVSIQTIGNMLNISDELVQTTSRLNLMNDGLQTTDELVSMVYVAAEDARGSFAEMSSVVARFGNNAKDAFSSSAEVVAFANLIQKQMTIAGASTAEASNAMLQLSQALGSGVLRGDELNSIFEQAPNLIQNIADYLDVPIGQIREIASQGELSADVVKAAIFAASDDINAKFNEMPMTWGQIWQSMQNTALIAFRPVLKRLNDLANSDDFQALVEGAIEAMVLFSDVVLDVFDLMATVGGFVVDNWSVIEPIILAVAAAFGIYTVALSSYNIVQAISNGLEALAAFQSSVRAASLYMEAGATFTATAAQYGFNTALLACPVTWILILIVAIIAALYVLAGVLTNTTGVFISGTGLVLSVLFTAAAIVWNIFVGIYNFIVEIFASLMNYTISVVEFFANVWTDPVGSIVWLFTAMADSILGVLAAIASAIDAVFGSNLTSAVRGWQSSLDGLVADKFGSGNVSILRMEADDTKLNRWAYEDAVESAMTIGNNFESNLADWFNVDNIPTADDFLSGFDTSGMNGIGDDISDIAGNTGSIADSMDVTEEELKYLRDIAEQEAVNKYTTAEIHIEQTNNNNISSDMDLDGVVTGLTDAVNEAVEIITEGVHV